MIKFVRQMQFDWKFLKSNTTINALKAIGLHVRNATISFYNIQHFKTVRLTSIEYLADCRYASHHFDTYLKSIVFFFSHPRSASHIVMFNLYIRFFFLYSSNDCAFNQLSLNFIVACSTFSTPPNVLLHSLK